MSDCPTGVSEEQFAKVIEFTLAAYHTKGAPIQDLVTMRRLSAVAYYFSALVQTYSDHSLLLIVHCIVKP